MQKTIVFDLDGTLADTAGDLLVAANTALQENGHKPVLEMGADDATAFRGGRAMLQLAVARLGVTDPDAVVEACYPDLLAAYGRALDVHSTLYPGVIPAIKALRAQGMATAICTNKPEAFALDFVDRFGLAHLFDALVGAGTLPVSKPDRAPYIAAVERSGGTLNHSLLVGDTETDRKTARAAGVPCVLVSFGPTGQAVAELEPEALLHHYDDLGDVVARLLPKVA